MWDGKDGGYFDVYSSFWPKWDEGGKRRVIEWRRRGRDHTDLEPKKLALSVFSFCIIILFRTLYGRESQVASDGGGGKGAAYCCIVAVRSRQRGMTGRDAPSHNCTFPCCSSSAQPARREKLSPSEYTGGGIEKVFSSFSREYKCGEMHIFGRIFRENPAARQFNLYTSVAEKVHRHGGILIRIILATIS